MDAQPAFGFQELMIQMVGEMAQVLAVRLGETKQQQFARLQAVANAIMAFLPRDAIEVMLAGRVLLFHQMLMDNVHYTLSGKTSPARPPIRGGIIALDKAFGDNLKRLLDYQSRPSEGRRDEPPTDPRVRQVDERNEPEITPQTPTPAAQPATADQPVARPLTHAERREAKKQGYAAQREARTQANAALAQVLAAETLVAEARAMSPRAETAAPAAQRQPYRPSPAEIAEVEANLAAMDALAAGDAYAFARALGVPEPSDDFLEAAAGPKSPFLPKT